MSLPNSYDDVPMAWVGDWAGRRAALTPEREAVYDPADGRRFTYRQLNARADRVGTFLLDELGLGPGDPVCFLGRNRVEPIDLYFACGKAGLILAPLSYRLAKPELDDLLARIQPKAFFYEDHLAELAESLALPDSVKAGIAFGDGESDYDRRALATEPRPVNRPLPMSAPFLYVHTGGTTATPKICVVTHRQMIWNSFDLLATGSGGTGIGGKELVTFPFFHVGGWNTVTPLFHIGGAIVLLREFDPGLALELIESEKISHFGGVEAMFRFMVQHPKFAETRFDSVLYVNSAGAPCAPEVMRPFWDRGVPVTQSYGLTEAGPSNFIFLPDEASYGMDDIRARAGSIGRPMYHCDVKRVDRETGQPVGADEVGELCFRSPHSFDGYLNDPQRTAQVVDEEGWVHSGDLARQDEDGFVTVVGRADQMFISGGENVSPEEIEQALVRHPAVAQAGVAGVADEEWGQVALAAVVLHPGQAAGAEELKAFSRERLAGYKVPKHWRFVSALPLTGAGKVDRNAIKKFLSEEP